MRLIILPVASWKRVYFMKLNMIFLYLLVLFFQKRLDHIWETDSIQEKSLISFIFR